MTEELKPLLNNKPTPLFGCCVDGCAEQASYPEEGLRVYNGELICEYCYDEESHETWETGRRSLAMDLFAWLGGGAMDRIHKFDPELLTELQDILAAARDGKPLSPPHR